MADQAVEVLVAASFPGMVGGSEVALERELLLERLVAVELGAVVECDSDDFPKVRGQTEAASLPLPSSRRIAVAKSARYLPSMSSLLRSVPADLYWVSAPDKGNIGVRRAAYSKLGDVVAFVLERVIVSQLAHFLAAVLHSVLESATSTNCCSCRPELSSW